MELAGGELIEEEKEQVIKMELARGELMKDEKKIFYTDRALRRVTKGRKERSSLHEWSSQEGNYRRKE